MSILDKRPEEIVVASFVDEYAQRHEVVSDKLVTLDCQITYLEKMQSFAKFLELIDPDKLHFLGTVLRTFGDTVVVGLCNLVGSEGLLLKVKSKTRQNLKPEYQAEFDRILREVKFTHTINDIRRRAIAHRNRRIAHLHPGETLPALPVADLRTLFRATKDLYMGIAPMVESVTLPLDYYDTSREDCSIRQDTDFDSILRFLLRESAAVHEPEQNRYWFAVRRKMPPQELDTLNEARSIVGLPPV